MLTISSVILPIPVEAAISSTNGLILSKYCSTASTRSLSIPKSKRAAPNVAAPSNNVIIPDGMVCSH